MFQLIDKKIRQAFSNAALEYDVLSSLHKEIGRELLAKLRKDDRECAHVLDVGMGTGWLTKRLAGDFMEAKVIGVDLAEGMVKKASEENQDFSILQADACLLPFKAESFDMVVSNLAYQWVNDLGQAFLQCHRILKKGGRLSLTMFGYDTFQELFISLHEALGKKPLAIRRLAKQDEIRQALIKSGFSDVKMDYERIKVRFPDMYGLLKWIKDIGANSLTKDFYVGKDLLSRANDHYDLHFKDRLGTYATFEVVWVDAIK